MTDPQPRQPAQAALQARARFEAGIAHFGAGRHAEAERCFADALVLAPGRPSILVNLAAARLHLDRPEAALEALAQLLPPLAGLSEAGPAAAAQPPGASGAPADPLAEAWLLRGHACGALGRADDALRCYRQIGAASAQHRSARFHAGEALYRLRRHAEALAEFEALIAAAPPRAETWWRHGLTLQALDRDAEALASHDAALALDATLADAWTQRGLLLKDRGRLDEAVHCFGQALAHGGDAALNGWWLAAVSGRAAPPQAPAEYVRRLFDGYAERFDTHLVEVLHYRAPEQLVQGLQRLLPGRRFVHGLDLGCGTGLCGPLLREAGGAPPLAERLDGIDLSPRMLAKARARGHYEALLEGDLTEVLTGLNTRHDLVLAVDVFIYLGELEPVFAAVRRVLLPGGVFCFSVERADDDVDHRLLPSLRYAHSQRHLQSLAARHGLLTLEMSVQVLREQQQQAVEGLFVYLQG